MEIFMKFLLLILALSSFSAFANEYKVPCDRGETHCTNRDWRETISFQHKKIYVKGISSSYAKAESFAHQRLETLYPNVSCGTFGAIVVQHEPVRLRDGRMGTEVWLRCNPDADMYKNQRPQRQGVCLGCGSGKGGVIVRGIPGL